MRLLVTDTLEWVSHPLTFLEKARTAGYTDVVVSVWHGKGARWFSPVVEWDPTVTRPEYDPIPALLAIAQEMDITVWASFTLGIQQLPSLHPEWTYQQATQWTRAFDWTNPEFREWIASVVEDYYLTHPTTPGLFLDYVRFWDGTNGPLAGDPDGRVAVVTDGVQQILGAVRSIHPAVLSMSFSNVDRLYTLHRSQGNDGRLWLQHGLIQYANCPAYDVDPRTRLTNIAADTADLPTGSVVASIATYTTGTQPRTPGALVFYTEAQRTSFPHVSHYFYPTLTETAAACLGMTSV
jgi:hypothetical protein